MPKNPGITFQTNELPEDGTLIVVDDDAVFLERLSHAKVAHGFEVRSSTTAANALSLLSGAPPGFAGVDLRLADGSSPDLIAALRNARPSFRITILTGNSNLPAVVHAVKLGALDYVTKPAETDEVTDALLAPPDAYASALGHPMSPDRARWLHIQSALQIYKNNVSETARRLNMHR